MTRKGLETFAKYAGLITVSVEWLGLILFYTLMPAYFSGQYPISYFAVLPETRLVFSICITIAAISFWIFTRYHLPKYYAVPVRVFAVSMFCYAAVGLLPYDPNNTVSDITHRALAILFSFSFLGGIYLTGRRNMARDVKVASYLAAGASIVALILFMVVPPGSRFILLLEVASTTVGQLWVVWISFHSFTTRTKKH